MASSKRLFAGRLFAGRQFEPSLFRGVGDDVVPLQITSIVGGWYIPGATIGERYQAGIVPTVNGLAGESYAAGAVVGEGRFK
jgi:hypothetical protein